MAEKVIFWDFDGTLAYQTRGWADALAALLSERNPAQGLTREDFLPFLREGFPWHTPHVPHPHLADPDDWWANLEPVFVRACRGVGVDEEAAREVARLVRGRFVDPRNYVLFDDVVPTLTRLRESGWRHRIISNHVPELSDIVESLGLGWLIEHVTSSASVGYEKPHPEIYRAALAAAGQATDVWMVGDNVEADVLGAERAGIRAILVRRQDSRARLSCADLGGVIDIVEGSGTEP